MYSGKQIQNMQNSKKGNKTKTTSYSASRFKNKIIWTAFTFAADKSGINSQRVLQQLRPMAISPVLSRRALTQADPYIKQ